MIHHESSFKVTWQHRAELKLYSQKETMNCVCCVWIAFLILMSKYTFLPRPHWEYSGRCWLDGSMMKWGEICSGERQNPTVSYEQFLSQGLIYGHLHQVQKPRPLLKGGGGRICWSKCWQEKRCVTVDTQTWLWLMLSMCRRYIPCWNSVNCIWCRCFPNQACCLGQTPFLD